MLTNIKHGGQIPVFKKYSNPDERQKLESFHSGVVQKQGKVTRS